MGQWIEDVIKRYNEIPPEERETVYFSQISSASNFSVEIVDDQGSPPQEKK